MIGKLRKLLPVHKTYVELFGGGASLLHDKPPSRVEVYNDTDRGLVNFWQVVRDPELFKKFQLAVSLVPYSREEFHDARATWEAQTNPVEKAVRWYTVARQCVSGDHRIGGWSFCRGESTRGMSSSVSSWLSAIDRLPEIHERWRRVQIEHDDFRCVLERYDSDETVFYCDPPYAIETRELLTRRRAGRYRHEMSLVDHAELVTALLTMKGKGVLSVYDHEVYEPLKEAGWHRVEFHTSAMAAGRTRQHGILGHGAATANRARVETVWISPNCNVQQSFF